jgi:hypothetical protein
MCPEGALGARVTSGSMRLTGTQNLLLIVDSVFTIHASIVAWQARECARQAPCMFPDRQTSWGSVDMQGPPMAPADRPRRLAAPTASRSPPTERSRRLPTATATPRTRLPATATRPRRPPAPAATAPTQATPAATAATAAAATAPGATPRAATAARWAAAMARGTRRQCTARRRARQWRGTRRPRALCRSPRSTCTSRAGRSRRG